MEQTAKERTFAFMAEHKGDPTPMELFHMHVKHVGINTKSEGEAWEIADTLARLMGLMPRETEKAVFSGDLTENMKVESHGTYGHIGFGVDDCEAAIQYFVDRGMTLREETKRFDEQGRCIFVYFKEEVGGFAIHLVHEKDSYMKKIIVIGGGAAGMAAAIAAAENGCAVTIYEKNEKLGKKIYITGKGRCNVTNDCDMDGLFDSVVTNSRFLYSAFYGFTNQDMKDFLEANGCHIKVERGNRVFPVSDRASDVTSALARRLRELHVKIKLNQGAKELWLEDGVLKGVILAQDGNGRGKKDAYIAADAVIVATGGLSYPTTGSTGDGYRFAEAAGHKVTELSPALVPFETEEDVKELQGLSLRNVEAAVLNGKKEVYREFGEMLFTHYGVSGPVLLSASSYAAKKLKKGPLTLTIDLKPALSMEQLDARILRDFETEKNKQFKNALNHLYPSKLIPVMIRRSGIEPDKQVNAVTKEERRRLAEVTKHFTLTLTGLRGFNEAIITQGGVTVKEVNPSTMESKKLPGLYFAGEVLDLDAVTGGYNLQIAWSTGVLAGRSVAGEV